MDKITSKIIPKPPAKLTKWLLGLGCFSSAYLIFKCGWETEPLTGIKNRCLDVVCSKCGAKFKATRLEDSKQDVRPICRKFRGMVGEILMEDGLKSTCPHCGVEAIYTHISETPRRTIECEWPLVVSKKQGKIILAGYRVMRTIEKDGSTSFVTNPYEAYVFDGKKAYRFAGWFGAMFGIQIFTGVWEPRKRFLDYYGSAGLIYYTQEDIFKDTQFENCKFDLYEAAARKKGYLRPVSFLREFQKHPQIENLITQGFEEIAVRCVESNIGTEINWKEKAPRKMLNLTKEDFNFLKYKSLDVEELKRFRLVRERLPFASQLDIGWIATNFSYTLEDLLKEEKVERLIRYIKKQKQSAREVYLDWKDYISTAKKLGYDITRDLIRYPKNFGAAHDRVTGLLKHKKSEELKLQFEKLYQELQPYCWEKNGLLIRPAASEDELIEEGKILDHCVGEYGEAHCKGRTIFFIRRISEPEVPYYTLQLDIKRKIILQNRGYKNNHAHNPKPPEIDQFAEDWLNHVVKADKPKKKKRNVA